jgi:hypothetical protein
MNSIVRSFLLVVAASVACAGRAQVVEFRAAINAAQEVPATASPATGTGRMFYDVARNTFDLFVTIDNFANPVTDTHTQEGAIGENGPAQNHLGAESTYSRSGTTISASFLNVRYPGDPLKLLRNGAYLNFHSGQFPRGEVRGQLIAQPKRLVANLTVAQEQAAFPTSIINSTAFGAAVMSYNPGTNQMSLRLNLYGFTNTLTNSHFHEGAPGVSGPVAVPIGAGTANGYSTLVAGWWTGSFEFPYTDGDPIKLLTGGAYLNFHSNVYPNGELRGQVTPSEELPTSRMINLSARGFVGAGTQALIGGLSLNGPEPIRVLITAKGPSLTSSGVTGALSDPVLSLFDANGRQIAAHDNTGALTIAAGSELARIPGLPFNPNEAMLLIVLPPGNYTAVVTGSGNASGIALLEALDLRTLGTLITN